MDPSRIREVKGIWSQSLKSGYVHGPSEAELYATLQKSPEEKVRYSAMGKLLEFVRQGHLPDGWDQGLLGARFLHLW